ncbi:MAG: hypothetical protein R3343_07075 [Nitriliruptorales bacterium]|nr:hypothetical protein [Nitriliruptorales bacterium]
MAEDREASLTPELVHELHQRALALNDELVQLASAAYLALMVEETDEAKRLVAELIEQLREAVGDLFEPTRTAGPLVPGDLVRRTGR